METIKKWINIKGRASRTEFWGAMLFFITFMLVFGYIGELIEFRFLPLYISHIGLIPFLATGMRRMQDVGKKGIFFFIPFYNFYIALTGGEKGPNQYGPNPRNS